MSERMCSVEECERPWAHREWCELHYDRWRRTGDAGEAAPRKVHRYEPGQLCKVEDCTRPVLARGWCQTHYARWRQTRGTDAEIDDLRYQRITGGPCSTEDCEDPVVAKGLCRRHYQSTRNRRDRATHPDRYLGYHLNRYEMSVAEYKALHEAQGGACAICEQVSERRLCVDHDHETGSVRGLLCVTCNAGLGSMKDSVENLRRAIAYLETHAA